MQVAQACTRNWDIPRPSIRQCGIRCRRLPSRLLPAQGQISSANRCRRTLPCPMLLGLFRPMQPWQLRCSSREPIRRRQASPPAMRMASTQPHSSPTSRRKRPQARRHSKCTCSSSSTSNNSSSSHHHISSSSNSSLASICSNCNSLEASMQSCKDCSLARPDPNSLIHSQQQDRR